MNKNLSSQGTHSIVDLFCIIESYCGKNEISFGKLIPIPKKDNAKECSNYRTIALISHASKVMLKILQARL